MGYNYSKIKKRFKRIFVLLFCPIILSLVISSCSGSSNDSKQPTSSNWDEMKWDQGKWG
jgi:hypothetical protein